MRHSRSLPRIVPQTRYTAACLSYLLFQVLQAAPVRLSQLSYHRVCLHLLIYICTIHVYVWETPSKGCERI